MGFTVITQHKAQSTNSLNLVIPFSTCSSLWNEPVENSGLSSSPYGDGYYLIGTDELTVHPGIIDYLYRKYTKTYDGETAYWTFDVHQTMAAIAAIIGASACASIAGRSSHYACLYFIRISCLSSSPPRRNIYL